MDFDCSLPVILMSCVMASAAGNKLNATDSASAGGNGGGAKQNVAELYLSSFFQIVQLFYVAFEVMTAFGLRDRLSVTSMPLR